MTRKERLRYCKVCKNQDFNPRKGIICNRTNELADFEGECMYYTEDTVQKSKLEANQVLLKDNSKRATIVVSVFWGICIINIIAVLSGYLEIDLLERISDNALYTEQEILSNDLRQGIVGVFQSILYICSIIFFLNWFRRAYWNLHHLPGSWPEYSDSMAVWSFMIPFVNLYRPYKIVKEISSGIKQKLREIDLDYNSAINHSVLIFWWVFFLITNYVGQFAFKTIFKDDTIEQLISSSQSYLISDALDIIAAIFTAIMIKQISNDEQVLFSRQELNVKNENSYSS